MKFRRSFVFILLLTIFILCSCRREVPQMKYYPNGNVKETCSLRNGKLSGEYKCFYENGNLYGEGEYRHNYPIGVWRTYYPDGKTMVVEEYSRRGKHINVNAWDKDGNQVIKNGTGTFIMYYPDGSLQSIGSYKDCMFEGANEAWYPNGIKEHEFYYKDGKPVGTWHFWDMNGNLYKTEEY